MQTEKDGIESQLAELDTGKSDLEARLADAEAARAEVQQELQDAKGQVAEQTALAETVASRLAALQQGSDAQIQSAQSLRDQIEAQLSDSGVENPAVSVRDDNSIVVNLPSQALFNSGRARLSSAGRGLMERVADALGGINNPILVEGHTDGIPVTGDLQNIYPSNWELSVARAANTVNYLENQGGIDPQRLSATGFGEQRPVAPNNTRAGRALNRRVEIVVKP